MIDYNQPVLFEKGLMMRLYEQNPDITLEELHLHLFGEEVQKNDPVPTSDAIESLQSLVTTLPAMYMGMHQEQQASEELSQAVQRVIDKIQVNIENSSQCIFKVDTLSDLVIDIRECRAEKMVTFNFPSGAQFVFQGDDYDALQRNMAFSHKLRKEFITLDDWV